MLVISPRISGSLLGTVCGLLLVAGIADANDLSCDRPGVLRRALNTLLYDSGLQELKEAVIPGAWRPRPTLILPATPQDKQTVFQKGEFPYASGHFLPDDPMGPPPGYKYDRPPVLKGTRVDLNDIVIPKPSVASIEKRLREAEGDVPMSPLGEGQFSQVFKITRQDDQSYAAKVRKHLVGQDARKFAARDMSVGTVVADLFSRATLDGEPFVRLAKDMSLPGTQWDGVSAFELADSVSMEFLADLVWGPQYPYTPDVLMAFGLTRQKAIHLIMALQQLCADVHDDILAVHAAIGFDEGLGVGHNFYRGAGKDPGLLEGVDYGHGRNFNYNPKERMVIAVDF